jgi:hypothetical protein
MKWLHTLETDSHDIRVLCDHSDRLCHCFSVSSMKLFWSVANGGNSYSDVQSNCDTVTDHINRIYLSTLLPMFRQTNSLISYFNVNAGVKITSMPYTFTEI